MANFANSTHIQAKIRFVVKSAVLCNAEGNSKSRLWASRLHIMCFICHGLSSFCHLPFPRKQTTTMFPSSRKWKPSTTLNLEVFNVTRPKPLYVDRHAGGKQFCPLGHQFWWWFKWAEGVPGQAQKLRSQSWVNLFFTVLVELELKQTPKRWGNVEPYCHNPVVRNFVDAFYRWYWRVLLILVQYMRLRENRWRLLCIIPSILTLILCASHHFGSLTTLTNSDQSFPRYRKEAYACASSRHPAPRPPLCCEMLDANGLATHVSQTSTTNLLSCFVIEKEERNYKKKHADWHPIHDYPGHRNRLVCVNRNSI